MKLQAKVLVFLCCVLARVLEKIVEMEDVIGLYRISKSLTLIQRLEMALEYPTESSVSGTHSQVLEMILPGN